MGIVLGGLWVVISGVRSRVTILITHIKGLITPVKPIHEPPSIPNKPDSQFDSKGLPGPMQKLSTVNA